MTPPDAPSFPPPTPRQVQDLLERHPPRNSSRLATLLPLFGMGAVGLAVALVVSGGGNVEAVALLMVFVFGLSMWMSARVGHVRKLEAQLRRVQEMGLLRRYRESLRAAWRLLPAVTGTPEMHGRVVAFIAFNLDQVQAYDAAIIAYDYMIDHLPPEHPAAVQFRIHRAIAMLAADRLTDADETLRRLRGQVEPLAGTPVGATYRLAMLIQQVKTNHAADAVEAGENLLDELRPLGVEAGFGHALIARCHQQLAEQNPDDTRHARRAASWWASATLLLPVAVLVKRFPDVAPLAAGATFSP